MLEWFKAGKTLPRRYAHSFSHKLRAFTREYRYVWEIAAHAYQLFVQEESMVTLPLEDGVTIDVIGDVHGQFYDMLHLLSLTGEPSETHCLLMNGDLVDRGSWSMEVILTALAYKCEDSLFLFTLRRLMCYLRAIPDANVHQPRQP